MPTATHCLQTFAAAVAPRRPLSVSQWAEANRVLVSKGSGEPGPYHVSRTPLVREIMDCFSMGSRIKRVTVMAGAQMAKTDGVMINVIGYYIDYLARPMLALMPTLEARDKWKIQKLNPLLQHTPCIRDALGGLKSRDATNTKDAIDFPGATLYLAGGNSAQSYAQVSAAFAMADDLDRFPQEVGQEGDPVALLKKRLSAFMGGKLLVASTPAELERSLIAREHAEGDMRRYHVPCPHCGEAQPLQWGGPDVPHGIKWNRDCTAAWYVCRACFGEIHEHHKPRMLAEGRWVATHPERSATHRSYHLSAIYCSIGLGPSWLDLAQEWLAAQKSTSLLKTFVNTQLGEPWEEKGERADPVGLLARLEDYPETLPAFVRVLGTDVQKNRLETTIIDVGVGEEFWVRDHVILDGDTAQPEVWKQLEELEAEWTGLRLVHGIDGGYNASMVKAFADKRGWRHILIGRDGSARPIVEDAKKRAQRLRRQRKVGKAAEIMGDDQAKTLIYARLKLTQPGPGYIHWPNDPAFDDEYFAQLTAEVLVAKKRGTRPILVWHQTRPRNEALDCMKLALAALRLANLNLDALAQTAKAEKPAAKAPAPRQSFVGRQGKGGFVQGWKK